MEKPSREELERRLTQANRLADGVLDALTKERLQNLVRELEAKIERGSARTAWTISDERPPIPRFYAPTQSKTSANICAAIDSPSTVFGDYDYSSMKPAMHGISSNKRIASITTRAWATVNSRAVV